MPYTKVLDIAAQRRITRDFIVLGLSFFCSWGCAGPSTPLGALWTLTPAKPSVALSRNELAARRNPASVFKGPSIVFSPDRQVLHGPARMNLSVDNLFGRSKKHELHIFYNGYDVTTAFLLQATLVHDAAEQRLVVNGPRLSLSPETDHTIEVHYRNPFGFAQARLEPPVCSAFTSDEVRSNAGFSTSAKIIRAIERHSSRAGLNSALMSGLIAQESGFNPRAVSWAKALGLTQMTPIADAELLETHSEWPRYPGIGDISAPILKMMVKQGTINSENEWRLHPERSIEGGIEYLRILEEQWSSKENERRIQTNFEDPGIARTQLMLASYHSGYSRVSAALQSHGKNWMSAPGLREARKYIQRIMSYCVAFSRSEGEA